MALLGTSVTERETHWTMIDSALSSPITGGIGLEHRRLVPVFEEYPVQGDQPEQDQHATPVPSTTATANDSAGQIPVQILQVATFLQSFLEIASEGNAALIEEIRRTRPGTFPKSQFLLNLVDLKFR